MDDKVKAQMELARQHIKSGEHDEARKLLSKINHPRAREWESKLPKTKRNRRKMIVRGVLIGLIVIALIGLAITIPRLQQNVDAANQAAEDYIATRDARP